MKNITKVVWVNKYISEILKVTKKLANWKAPGFDQVQNFWLKHLTPYTLN